MFPISLFGLQSGRTIAFGVDNSPPFYVVQADGTVEGLAVEVLNEAARRRGIHIAWTPLSNVPLDDALAKRQVQAWPLVGTTAERRARLFLSEPWLESDYVLISRKTNPVRSIAEARNLTVTHARLRLTTALAKRFLPFSKLVILPNREAAVQEMCAGNAAAALVESRVLDAMLLDRPKGCLGLPLNISTVPGATTPLSIAAVPEVSSLARELREEISRMALDGDLARRMDKWTPFSAEGSRAVWAARLEAEKNRNLKAFAYGMVIFALGLGFLVHRALRLKRLALEAQAQMRIAQERFTQFMDHSPAMAFVKDMDGRMIYMNQAVQSFWAVRPEDWLGKTDSELWPPEIARALREADRGILQAGESREILEQVPAPNGETRHFLSVKFPFSAGAGELLLGGMAIDITSRYLAEEALRRSEGFNRSILDNAVDLIETINLNGEVISSNSRWSTSRRPNDSWVSIWKEDNVGDAERALSSARSGEANQFNATLNGESQRWCSVYLSPILNPDTLDVERILVMARDITALRRSQKELAESEARYRELFEANPLPAWLYDTRTLRFVDVNRAAIEKYGYSRERFLAMTLADIRPQSEMDRVHERLRLAESERKGVRPLWQHVTSDGRTLTVETIGHTMSTPQGEVRLTVVHDVTERERITTQLKNSENRYRSVVEHAADIIYQTDGDGRFSFCNDGALRALELRREEVLRHTFTDLIHPDDRASARRFYGRQLSRKQVESYFEFRCITGTGQVLWLGQNVQLLFDDTGRPDGFQAIARDITARRAAEGVLARAAAEDALTGLPNRRALLAHLEMLIRNQTLFTFCLCDVDSFKTVNDTFGHSAGDDVLRVFASICRQNIRKTDFAARLGGDEFCLVLPQTPPDAAQLLVERVRQEFATISFTSDAGRFSVTATFGLASWKPPMTIRELTDAADTVLYEAKKRGKNLVISSPTRPDSPLIH